MHFKTFFIREGPQIVSKITIKKVLFLTYLGLTRLLFVSRNKNAEHFQKWAIEKLFTIQMGSEERREQLGCEILNINIQTYRDIFKLHASKLPCIYLLRLGRVKELRMELNLMEEVNDEEIVYKYGFTDSLERRLREHQDDYGKIKNVDIKLECFHYIDVKFMSNAENALRQFFKTFRKSLEVNGRKELVSLGKKELLQVLEMYKYIGNDFAGSTIELQRVVTDSNRKIENMEIIRENETLKMNGEIERMNMEMNLERKEHEIALYKKSMETENEILRKNNEIDKKNYEIEKKNMELEIRKMELIFKEKEIEELKKRL